MAKNHASNFKPHAYFRERKPSIWIKWVFLKVFENGGHMLGEKL